MRSFLLWVALLGATVSWAYSNVAPQTLGICHDVAVYLGPHPTVRDCQPYGTTDLAVLVGVILAAFLVTGDGDVTITIPGVASFERTRKAKAAASFLQDDADFLARAAKYSEFLRTLETQDAPEARR